MRRSLLLAPLVILMVAACGSGDDDDVATTSEPPSTTSSPTTPPTATAPSSGSPRPPEDTVVQIPGAASVPVPVPPGGPTGSAEEDEAIADLAARQGADASAVTVVSSEDVTWRDGSIGCPDPGMIYTQALVPGTRIVLELNSVRYEYHSGGPRSIFLCEQPEAPLEG